MSPLTPAGELHARIDLALRHVALTSCTATYLREDTGEVTVTAFGGPGTASSVLRDVKRMMTGRGYVVVEQYAPGARFGASPRALVVTDPRA